MRGAEFGAALADPFLIPARNVGGVEQLDGDIGAVALDGGADHGAEAEPAA